MLTKKRFESEPNMVTLMSTLPGAAYRCHANSRWSLAFISDGCEALCGYTAEQLLANQPAWFDVIHPADRAAVDAHVTKKLAAKQAYQSVYRIRRSCGEERWVWEQGQGLYAADGTLIGLEGFISDTTELQQSREKLLQAERLAAMGQMLTGIAHESRNALQRIQASVDMLGIELEASSEAAGDVARIARAREDLQRLFEELRSYTAPIHLQVSTCDLAETWHQAWEELDLARKGRDAFLQVTAEEVDLHCKVDSFRLQQVFRNLLENALAACDDPLRITIECQNSTLQGAPALCISVRDNGPGLSSEQKQRVFDAFYTTKTKGTGLGLAIARRIIDAHGGSIRVGSAVWGAAFEIILPRDQSA